jgi:hypothetical protein
VRRRDLIFPLALILIGVVVLLANVGVLSSVALQRLADLWPLLLVLIGLQLILNHTLPRNQATIIGLAVTGIILVAAIAYAALAPSTSFGTQHAESSQRLTGLSAATLELNYSASSVEIRTGSVGDDLYKAQVDYPAGENPPNISLDQSTGTVSISGSGGSLGGFHLFGASQRHLIINLATSVPWTIRVSGGATSVRMDVRELKLSNLEISGGASSVNAQLGAPKGTVGIHVTGGANSVTLHAPEGSQWSVSASGGVSSVTINGQSSGGFGNFSKQSAAYSGASDRFDVELAGGVSHLEFRTG